jgi:F-type H+-transporting ATPase subunit alpha
MKGEAIEKNELTGGTPVLQSVLDGTFRTLDEVLASQEAELREREVGVVCYVGYGIAHVEGLPSIRADELVLFPQNLQGLAFNIDPEEIGVILLGDTGDLRAGAEVRRTGRILDVPVGEALIGRVVDALGVPLDDRGEIRTVKRLPVEREAPPVMARDPVTTPLQTGIKVIDALFPIGRGQRELIVGDRQTGKTAIAMDAIINQADKDVLCIYCTIGKKASDVAKVIADLKHYKAMDYTLVVAATGDDPPGLQFIAPYAATSMGEYFISQGRDVLIIYDDLTSHARAYRELSLLLRRPPGREAFPGDIFYIHSRLLERSTHLRKEHGGGSLTSLPIVETEAQDISGYIPTNLISITDGQLYLSPRLFQKGILPAVDVGKSVSRVGGKAQLPAFAPWQGICASPTHSLKNWRPFRGSARVSMRRRGGSSSEAGASVKSSSSPSTSRSPWRSRSHRCWRSRRETSIPFPWRISGPPKRRCARISGRTRAASARASEPERTSTSRTGKRSFASPGTRQSVF